LHLVDLVLRTSRDDDEAIALATSALASLYDSDEGAAHFRLFETILYFVNREFGYWPEVSLWPVKIRLAMMWAHACWLHNLFYAAGATVDELAKTFRSENIHLGPDVLSRDPNYWNDVLHPRRLNRTSFLTHGASKLLGENDSGSLEAVGLKDLVMRKAVKTVGEVKIPTPELLRDQSLALNSTGSFLGGDRAEALSPLIEEDVRQVVASSNLEQLVKELLEKLEANPNEQSWATIDAIVWDLPFYSSLLERLKSLLENLDFSIMLKADPTAAQFALRLAGSQMARIADEEIRARFERALLEWAKYQSGIDSEGLEKEQHQPSMDARVGEVVEIAMGLSVKPNDPRFTSRAFTNLLRQVALLWPSFGEYIGQATLRLAFELPAAQLHGMWPLLLTLRASQPQAL
jgi:hypothetical protein